MCFFNNRLLCSHIGDNFGNIIVDRQLTLNRKSLEYLYSKSKIDSFMRSCSVGSLSTSVCSSKQNFMIEDLHLQSSDTCLTNFFLDSYFKKCFYKFGKGYWPINIFSLMLTCTYPEVDNQKLMFSSKPLLLKALNSTSSVFIKRNSNQNLHRF